MAIDLPAANEKLSIPDHSKKHRVFANDQSASDSSVTVDSNDLFSAAVGKCGFTPEGGFYVTLINKTGGVSVKGYLVRPSSGNDNAFELVPSEDPDVIGVIYDVGIADGAACRIVVAGIAEVYVNADGATRGDFVRMNTSGDTSTASGVATAEAVPTSPFSTDKHFQESGHALTGRVDAGLITCMVHFN